ncbi:MAG: glycosyltransferase [Deltaproteobacteria bacterium]|nr:glycosyltransferase [Deltaproteobacteria bacterium]
MKVCDISSFYSDLGGGVRTYHHQKLAWFARHPEHEYVMIVAGPDNQLTPELGGRVYRVRGVPVSRKGHYRQLADYREIRRILQAERPDVIEVGSAYLDCWLAWAAGRDSRAVFSGFYHADFPDSYIAPAVSGLPAGLGRPFVNCWRHYVNFVYRRFDVTCVTSRYVQDKLRGFGLHNTFLVPLGVDTERFHPRERDERLRRELGVAPGETLLLYVGRFWSEKGIDVLASAMDALGRRPGLHLALAGDGALEDRVRAAAAPHPRIRLLGFVADPARLARLYASADVFLSPGPYETFGLTTVEALSSGVPVVAADGGGAGETVAASDAGRLFRAHDPRDFIRRIDELLAADLPALGRRARCFAERNYSWQRTFGRLVGRYAELCDARRASAALAA